MANAGTKVVELGGNDAPVVVGFRCERLGIKKVGSLNRIVSQAVGR